MDPATSVGFLEWWLLNGAVFTPHQRVLWKFVGCFRVATMPGVGSGLQRDARYPAMHGTVSQEKSSLSFKTFCSLDGHSRRWVLPLTRKHKASFTVVICIKYAVFHSYVDEYQGEQ